MRAYYLVKRLLLKRVLKYEKRLHEFNLKMTARRQVKNMIKTNRSPRLSFQEIKAVRAFYKSKGYSIKNTYWHQHYKAVNGEFHVDYIPEDIFRAIISPRFNQMKQWPALLDKNLYYQLFKEFHQPKPVVQNINGFYYVDEEIVSEEQAAEVCYNSKMPLVIKPTIESGKGKMVESFSIKDGVASHNQLDILSLFEFYKKDFIIQEFVEQSEAMKKLNPTTLNTLRIMTYLRPDDVYILSAVSRIGKPGSRTDNYSAGGILCGITQEGHLKKYGYTLKGEKMEKTYTGIVLEGYEIPSFPDVVKMIKAMHKVVPYFRIISWDIGIDKNNAPLLVEYNTYYQSTRVHQTPNGPLFGKFTDEILAEGLKPY